MLKILSSLFDSNEKQLKKIEPIVKEINDLEDQVSKLSDDELRSKTDEFRKRIGVNLDTCRTDFFKLEDAKLNSKLEEEKKKLYEILPEAFAVAREASKRVANHRHFDVQLIAGYVLFDNKIAELFTGEGKTLAANLPLYLYGLTGRGAHLVTVNDYLARRDAEWTGHILNALGMSVGAINSGKQFRFISDEEAIKLKGDEARKLISQRKEMEKRDGRLKYDHMTGVNLIECSKKETYACDVVYGTNSEFGFDYLRDNMVRNLDERVQGPKYFAIVDEADSILIDEARTPLIISTSADTANDLYRKFAQLVKNLRVNEHYTVDEKANAVSLNQAGMDAVEKALGVDNIYENAQLAYHLDNALKAKELYKLDDEYIIRNGEIVIIDEFTGRAMEGRRYSEGLHQAIEAKEGVEVKKESKTMATITLQNFFRLYKYLSGMTGTALTEAEEFSSIYKLDTIVVPTNKPVIRVDHNDVVYRTQEGKFRAIVEEIKEHHKKGQPMLVGTTSVEKSEILSNMLSKEGIKHNVLNAKQHELEAKIVAEAGQLGAVTIATNMAGRGTDIGLGEGVKEVGGLYVIGTERHESRRIDNQLRGRSGRQGDPGESRFFVSFEDDLMRIFGGDRMKVLMSQVGMDDDMPISVGIIGRTIENAQKKVEANNYDIRKRLVEYDDVLNQQREIIYTLRRKILEADRVGNKKLTEKDFKNDIKAIKDIDIENVQDGLDMFSLAREESWKMDLLDSLNYPFSALDKWVLKKLLEYVDFLIASEMQDDMAIDNVEERKMYSQIVNMLTEPVLERACKELGYKNTVEFFRELYRKSGNESSSSLKKVILMSYVTHVYNIGIESMQTLLKYLILESFDKFWMEHLDNMTDLREGISLRNLAQRDPLVEYKNEGFAMFDSMLKKVDEFVLSRLFKVRLVKVERDIPMETKSSEDNRPGKVGKQKTVQRGVKVGRNDPCPCGSGKKYKKCCYPKYG
ncbi:MAG TPA: SEC-C metal-binding domain-containing protein [Candidatus Dojkabacteria bacterium]|nr:SEC-C metal-binding domain-containing protein [Candidatus Dojkabacteria bacterium]